MNIEDKNSLAAIDSRALSVKANWDMPGSRAQRPFHGSRSPPRVLRVQKQDDGRHGRRLGQAGYNSSDGEGPDASTFSPKLGMAFSSNGEDGTLTVVHEDSPEKFTVVSTCRTETGARTMALDEDTGTVYLVSATVGPTLILSFILEIFRSIARPAEGFLGGILVLISLLLLFRARKRGWTKKLSGGAESCYCWAWFSP